MKLNSLRKGHFDFDFYENSFLFHLLISFIVCYVSFFVGGRAKERN